jgi:hypothetical protein
MVLGVCFARVNELREYPILLHVQLSQGIPFFQRTVLKQFFHFFTFEVAKRLELGQWRVITANSCPNMYIHVALNGLVVALFGSEKCENLLFFAALRALCTRSLIAATSFPLLRHIVAFSL